MLLCEIASMLGNVFSLDKSTYEITEKKYWEKTEKPWKKAPAQLIANKNCACVFTSNYRALYTFSGVVAHTSMWLSNLEKHRPFSGRFETRRYLVSDPFIFKVVSSRILYVCMYFV